MISTAGATSARSDTAYNLNATSKKAALEIRAAFLQLLELRKLAKKKGLDFSKPFFCFLVVGPDGLEPPTYSV